MIGTHPSPASTRILSGWRASIADPVLAAHDWISWLGVLDSSPASLPDYRQLKQGDDTDVFVTHLRPDLPAVVKHTRHPGLFARFTRMVRPSAEAHEFRLAQLLTHHGIQTPQPLALLERIGWTCDSILVTRFVDHLRDLDQVVMVELPRRKGPQLARLKRDLAEQLARSIAAFHRAGFSHRDLKASNILVTLPADPHAAPAVWLVDLKGVTHRDGPHAAGQIRALARLAASLLSYRSLTHTDYARFLSFYLTDMGLKKREWRRLYRTLAYDAHNYNRRAKSRKAGKIDGYGGV